MTWGSATPAPSTRAMPMVATIRVTSFEHVMRGITEPQWPRHRSGHYRSRLHEGDDGIEQRAVAALGNGINNGRANLPFFIETALDQGVGAFGVRIVYEPGGGQDAYRRTFVVRDGFPGFIAHATKRHKPDAGLEGELLHLFSIAQPVELGLHQTAAALAFASEQRVVDIESLGSFSS